MRAAASANASGSVAASPKAKDGRVLGVGAQQGAQRVHVHPLVPAGDPGVLPEVAVERPRCESLLVERQLDALQAEEHVQDAGVLLRGGCGAREPAEARNGTGARDEGRAPGEGPSQDLRSAQVKTVLHRPPRPGGLPRRRRGGRNAGISKSGSPIHYAKDQRSC